MREETRDLDSINRRQVMGAHCMGHSVSERVRQCGFLVPLGQEWDKFTWIVEKGVAFG